jgi:thiol-disulfide isomerase/thioredoxin
VLGIAAVVVVAAVIAFVVTRSGTANAGPQTYPVQVIGTPLPQLPNPPAQDPAVGMKVPTLKGQNLLTAAPMTIAPDGKNQMVVFLAHWCPHCQADMPILVQWLNSGSKPANLEVAAVATGTKSSFPNYPPSDWFKRSGWPAPVMADSSNYDAATAYGLPSYPFVTIFGPDGTVKARISQQFTLEQLEQFVSSALASS